MDQPRDENVNYPESLEGVSTLTVFDIAAWRKKRFQKTLPPFFVNGKMNRDIVEEINAKVTIKTNIVDKIEVPVKAFVEKPKILPQVDIDFGKV